jgi:hypothetical protein
MTEHAASIDTTEHRYVEKPTPAPEMTLRDYFAVHALPVIYADARLNEEFSTIADMAYQMADAMLAARKS